MYAPTHGGMARLSKLVAWINVGMVDQSKVVANPSPNRTRHNERAPTLLHDNTFVVFFLDILTSLDHCAGRNATSLTGWVG